MIYLGLDLGSKTLGLAISDRTATIATSLEVIRYNNYEELFTKLDTIVYTRKVDVFVLESQHRLFTASSLIQIAGRAGRSIERPTGLVYFFHNGLTKQMTRAISDIRKMNRLGGFS